MIINLFKKFNGNIWLKRGLQVIIILFCTVYIVKNLQQINVKSIDLNYGYIIISLLATMVGTSLGAVSWWLTLRCFNQSLDFKKVKAIQFKSNLAKYIPGYGWQLVGKGYLSINAGIPVQLTGFAIIFEYIEIFLTGIILAAFTLPADMKMQYSIFKILSNNIHIIQITSISLIIAIPIILRFFPFLKIRNEITKNLKMSPTFLLAGLMISTWLINSVGFYALLSAIDLRAGISFQFNVFILTVTFLIGLLIIIVPGSLGIRESLFIFFLSPFIGASQAGLIAILYRVITIAAEVLVYFINSIRPHFSLNLPKQI